MLKNHDTNGNTGYPEQLCPDFNKINFLIFQIFKQIEKKKEKEEITDQ